MNPVFLKLGPIELHYYGLMYAIAFYVGITLGKKIAKERNFDVELVEGIPGDRKENCIRGISFQ